MLPKCEIKGCFRKVEHVLENGVGFKYMVFYNKRKGKNNLTNISNTNKFSIYKIEVITQNETKKVRDLHISYLLFTSSPNTSAKS